MIDTTIRLVGANGLTVTLLDSAEDLMREPGGSGWGMVPVVNAWFEGAGDGAQLRGTRRTQRELVIPVSAFGMNRAQVELQLRKLANTIHDPFTVFMDFADGRSYWIKAVYDSGASGQYGRAPEKQAKMPIVLKSVGDPYWVSIQSQTFTVKPAAGDPFLPELAELHVSSSVAQGSVTVNNIGDVASRPTWTIHGPGTGLELMLDGRGLSLPDYVLGPTDVITIAFVDGGWIIEDAAGNNLYTELGPAPWFPEFPPGTSLVTVELTDATGETFIQAVYPERREVMY
ncbi:minor tail protein [Microbacterium phage Franklin22]|uniref:minor tail protein n=1 Tax=Microbacterium phage Franklin22 TaxID=2894293 RepID=UPI001E72E974|nr:minor tail protein [Microbacterium phage Franklin22]UGL61830.1 minor tail protein [Microbacterium phage Franklin22]